MVWARFNVLMAANSIVIGASVLLLTRGSQFLNLARLLPITGLALCIAWLILTWGGMEYFRYLTCSARELEEKYLYPVETLSRGAAFEDSKEVTIVLGGKPELMKQCWLLRWKFFEFVFYSIIIIFMFAHAAMIYQAVMDPA